jgi:biotin carboxylase
MPVRSRPAARRKPLRSAPTVLVAARPRTVLTVGVTGHDTHWLGRIHRPERFRYVPLGNFSQADNPELCRPRAFVAAAVAEAKRLHEPFHGVVAFDDYPASLLAAAIAEKLGLPGPSLASIVACNNKAWSRLFQAAVVPQAVPRFQVIDPHRTHRPGDLELDFPFWLKPVKSSMSYLGFRIASFAEFERALALSRAGLQAYSAAFQELMDMVRPLILSDAANLRADWLIAEELLGGRQCTLDGMMSAGELTLIGVVDSIRLPSRVSFARFDYPSRLRLATQERMKDIARRVLRRIGFDNGLFNIEFFVDERAGEPKIIEINPRFSPQFSDLFEKVDGTLTHQYVVEMATGERPAVTRRRGRHRIAASCVLRVARDHIVARAPTARDIARLRSTIPDTHVYVTSKTGERLSEAAQDSYSYRYGLIHLGARDRRDLKRKLYRAKKLLRFRLKPVK